MADRTVRCRPVDGIEFDVVGSDVDRGVLLSIEQHGGRYEEGISRLLRRVLPPDGVAVDVGANIGVITALLARLAPAGRVYAFEPADENFDYLRRNLAVSPNVVAKRAAVLDRDGPVHLEFNVDYPAGSFISEGADAGEVGGAGAAVEGLTLDGWARAAGLTRLDVLKVDVEGAEPSVLRGARATIDRFRPVTILECNVRALRSVSGVSFREFFDELRAMFPRVAVVEASGETTTLRSVAELELVLGHHGVVDLVGLPDQRLLPGVVEAARSWARLRRLARAHTPRRPPERNFVVSPAVTLSTSSTPVSGAPGSSVEVPVTVANHGRWWLSSDFTYEPVNLSYHWSDQAGRLVVQDGRRTRFPEPVAPGTATTLDATVDLPGTAGAYSLIFTLVQESFAWLDEIDPSCRLRLSVEVAG